MAELRVAPLAAFVKTILTGAPGMPLGDRVRTDQFVRVFPSAGLPGKRHAGMAAGAFGDSGVLTGPAGCNLHLAGGGNPHSSGGVFAGRADGVSTTTDLKAVKAKVLEVRDRLYKAVRQFQPSGVLYSPGRTLWHAVALVDTYIVSIEYYHPYQILRVHRDLGCPDDRKYLYLYLSASLKRDANVNNPNLERLVGHMPFLQKLAEALEARLASGETIDGHYISRLKQAIEENWVPAKAKERDVALSASNQDGTAVANLAPTLETLGIIDMLNSSINPMGSVSTRDLRTFFAGLKDFLQPKAREFGFVMPERIGIPECLILFENPLNLPKLASYSRLKDGIDLITGLISLRFVKKQPSDTGVVLTLDIKDQNGMRAGKHADLIFQLAVEIYSYLVNKDWPVLVDDFTRGIQGSTSKVRKVAVQPIQVDGSKTDGLGKLIAEYGPISMPLQPGVDPALPEVEIVD